MRLTIKAAAHSQIKDVDRNGTEFENLRYTFSGLHTASGEERLNIWRLQAFTLVDGCELSPKDATPQKRRFCRL